MSDDRQSRVTQEIADQDHEAGSSRGLVAPPSEIVFSGGSTQSPRTLSFEPLARRELLVNESNSWALFQVIVNNIYQSTSAVNLTDDEVFMGISTVLGFRVRYTYSGDHVSINDIDFIESDNLLNNNLPNEIARQLEERLKAKGVNVNDAAQIARAASDFADVAELGPAEQSIAFDLAVAAVLADRDMKERDQSTAQTLWVNRDPDETPTAESFLLKHYGTRLGLDGDLTNAELGRIDPGLQTALSRQFRGRREELRALLPTIEDRRNAQFLKDYGYIPVGADRTRKLSAESRKPQFKA